MNQRDLVEREVGGGIGMGNSCKSWLIHVNVWQKSPQYCKVISLQQIKGKKKITKKNTTELHNPLLTESFAEPLIWRKHAYKGSRYWKGQLRYFWLHRGLAFLTPKLFKVNWYFNAIAKLKIQVLKRIHKISYSKSILKKNCLTLTSKSS